MELIQLKTPKIENTSISYQELKGLQRYFFNLMTISFSQSKDKYYKGQRLITLHCTHAQQKHSIIRSMDFT